MATLANINYQGNVYAAPGVIKHIKKRHKNELSKYILDNIIDVLKIILTNPQYIGYHNKKIGKSIEFIKKIDDNILVATELDVKEGYLYVSSMYPIKQAKIETRLNSNRIKQYK
jgi:hypothetical protein